MELQELKKEEQRLNFLLFKNVEKQQAINEKDFFELFSIKFGDMVEFMDWGKPVKGALFKINFSQSHEVQTIIVKKLNKAGGISHIKHSCRCSNFHTLKKLS